MKGMKTNLNRSASIIPDTKQAIIDESRRSFSEYGYLGVSMSDIAKKLHITKAALYYHFSGKAEIYETVLDEVFSELNSRLNEAMDETPIDRRLHRVIGTYLEFGRKEKNLIKALVLKLSPGNDHLSRHIAEWRKRIALRIRSVVESVSADGESFGQVDGGLLTSMLTGMMDGLLLEHSFLGKKTDLEKMSDQIVSALFSTMRRNHRALPHV
ncbi:MAG: TetR/AcrR family transcriptional regulator [Candidatus Moranbacteria bacterium]|nr:TetR/AcrR family transcriptional regulator [Candidatus Moranbacteria bacterium]